MVDVDCRREHERQAGVVGGRTEQIRCEKEEWKSPDGDACAGDLGSVTKSALLARGGACVVGGDP